MADISITIGAETKVFDLAKDENRKKKWAVSEQPINEVTPFTQVNWQGGMGQELFNRPESMDDMYEDGLGIDTRQENQIILGPLITEVDPSDTILGFAMFADREYCYSNTKVYRRNAGGTTWDTVLTPADPGIKCLGVYDDYIFCGTDDANYYYSSTGSSGAWTLCTLDNSTAHFFTVAPALSGTKDVFVLSTIINEVRTTLLPLNAAGPWLDPPYYVGDITNTTNSLFVFNGDVFVGKENGLYLILNGKPLPLISIAEKVSSDNFKYWTGDYNSSMYLSLYDDILELDSSYRIRFISPLSRFPLTSTATIQGLASDTNNLYVAFKVGSTYIIYAGRERRNDVYGLRWEWTPLVNLGTNAITCMKVMKSGTNSLLWFSYGTSVGYIILANNPDYPLGDSACRFATGGYLITSYFDANHAEWSKVFYQLWTIARRLTADIKVEVYYELDASGSWTLLATATSAGVKTTDVTTITGYKVRLKIVLITNSNTTTPVVEMVSLRSMMKPELSRMLDFTLILGQSSSRKPSSDLTFLRGGRTSTSLVTIKDLRFGTTRYVTFLAGSPIEIETYDEAARQPSFQARIVAQELDYSPP